MAEAEERKGECEERTDGKGRLHHVTSHKDLLVYRNACELAVAIYRCTGGFPPEEMHGLTMQMRRAAVSIPSNIAEGYRRCSRNEYRHFLVIARGSCAELETQLSISRDLGFLAKEDYNRLFSMQDFVSILLYRLIKKICP
jgi:four helix bundle protein